MESTAAIESIAGLSAVARPVAEEATQPSDPESGWVPPLLVAGIVVGQLVWLSAIVLLGLRLL